MRKYLLAGVLVAFGFGPAQADLADDCEQAADSRKAIEACSQIINNAGSDRDELVAAYSNRGASYADLRMYQRAMSDYSRALDLNPSHSNTIFNRGNAHCDTGQTDAALEDYLNAVRIGDRAAEALQGHLRNLGDYNGPVDGRSNPDLESAIRIWVARDCRG